MCVIITHTHIHTNRNAANITTSKQEQNDRILIFKLITKKYGHRLGGAGKQLIFLEKQCPHKADANILLVDIY